VSIPTIGIGAGINCDGQVLVLHDVLGLCDSKYRFAKHYGDLRTSTIEATQAFISDVRSGAFPDDAHSFH
jgi:3-methyl-2-oxobutanoate hydroxymethyltransferase